MPSAEGEPAPAPEIEAARTERLAGDRGVAAAAQHPLLQEHQRAGHDHQDDRNRGRGVVERRRPVGELEDIGGQHRQIGRRAQHRRNAVDAEHHDERQQHARDDRRHDQRERHREQRRERAGAGDLGGLLQARVHVAQRRGGEHVDIGRVIDAEHEHQAPQRIEIDAPVEPDPFEHGVDQAGLGRAEDRPRHARDQRRREQRQDAGGGDEPLERRVGADHDPGEQQPDHDRDRGAAAAGDQRVEQRLGDIRVRQHDEEIGDREMAQADAVDHRIGVGERAEQQHQDRIDDEKAQDRQQEHNPQAGPHAPAHPLTGATHDFAAPARLSVQSASPRPATVRFRILFQILRPQCAGSLVDRAAGGKLAESRRPKCRRSRQFQPAGRAIPSFPHRLRIRIMQPRACGAAQRP